MNFFSLLFALAVAAFAFALYQDATLARCKAGSIPTLLGICDKSIG